MKQHNLTFLIFSQAKVAGSCTAVECQAEFLIDYISSLTNLITLKWYLAINHKDKTIDASFRSYPKSAGWSYIRAKVMFRHYPEHLFVFSRSPKKTLFPKTEVEFRNNLRIPKKSAPVSTVFCIIKL